MNLNDLLYYCIELTVEIPVDKIQIEIKEEN